MTNMFTELSYTSERISVPVLFRIYDAACSFWMTGNIWSSPSTRSA
jgi:hypothetical protein